LPSSPQSRRLPRRDLLRRSCSPRLSRRTSSAFLLYAAAVDIANKANEDKKSARRAASAIDVFLRETGSERADLNLTEGAQESDAIDTNPRAKASGRIATPSFQARY